MAYKCEVGSVAGYSSEVQKPSCLLLLGGSHHACLKVVKADLKVVSVLLRKIVVYNTGPSLKLSEPGLASFCVSCIIKSFNNGLLELFLSHQTFASEFLF